MLGVGITGPLAGDSSAGDLGDRPARFPAPPDEEPGGPGRPAAEAAVAERDAWAILAGVHGLGPVGLGVLLERFGSGRAVLGEAATPGGPARLAACVTADYAPGEHGLPPGVAPALADAIARAVDDADRMLVRIRSLGLEVLTVADPAYPRRLASIEMPPHVVYVLGAVPALEARSAVAVVGTRRATDAGRSTASRIARDLVAVGSSVVSGLAVGIDGAAHAAAVRAGGTTVAVIGSGHGTLHPRAHERLADSIVRAGGAIVSELGPDVAPSRGTFPRRNRIVSGLADATVVVEAPARSGALITASWALEQGRPCFLVPGRVDDVASAGCLAFLREFPDAARIVSGIPQLIDDLGLAEHLEQPSVSGTSAAALVDIGPAADRLGRELLAGRATVDELVAATGWPVAGVLAGLTLLERRGLAVGIHGRYRPAGPLTLADPAPRGQRPRPRR